MYLVSTKGTEDFASSLSEKSGNKLIRTEVQRFPDGEMYVRIEEDLTDKDVMVVANLRGDSQIIEAFFLLDACREMGCRKLYSLIPYFGYSRQHMAYKKGEAVSARVMMKNISEKSDRIFTVDIHDRSSFSFSSKPVDDFSASGPISRHFIKNDIDVVISPDDGAFERAKKVSENLKCRADYLEKKRISSNEVEHAVKNLDVQGKNVLLVDDIISTGNTIIDAAKIIKSQGAKKIFVSATHGLFLNNSSERIIREVNGLAVTNTLKGEYSRIDITGDLSRFMGDKIE